MEDLEIFTLSLSSTKHYYLNGVWLGVDPNTYNNKKTHIEKRVDQIFIFCYDSTPMNNQHTCTPDNHNERRGDPILDPMLLVDASSYKSTDATQTFKMWIWSIGGRELARNKTNRITPAYYFLDMVRLHGLEGAQVVPVRPRNPCNNRGWCGWPVTNSWECERKRLGIIGSKARGF